MHAVVKRIQEALDRPSVCLIVSLVLLFFLMRPGMIMWVSDGVIAPFFSVARWLAVILSIVLYLCLVGIDVFGAACLFLALFGYLSLAINDQSMFGFQESWAPACAAALLARALSERYLKSLLWAVMIVSSMISVANLATILIFPGGIPGIGTASGYYFNGHRNQAIAVIIPSVFSSLILDAMGNSRFSLRSALLLIVGFSQVILAYSATSSVTLVVALIGIVTVRGKRARWLLNAYTYLAVVGVIFLLIVVCGLQNSVGSGLVGLLGKDATFTGRTVIWGEVIKDVWATHPLIGCGHDTFWNGWMMVGSAHNMVLEVLAQGGILGVLTYFSLLLVVARNLYSRSGSLPVALISLAIGCFLLVGLAEQTRWASFFLFLGIGYGAPSYEVRTRFGINALKTQNNAS